MSDKKTLGAELRRGRIAAGLTVAELSTRSRVREAYLTAIEENREEPSAGALQRIAQHIDPSGAFYEELAQLLVQTASPAEPLTDLQFDRVVNRADPSAAPDAPVVSCGACHQSITTEYFQVNGLLCCGRCRMALETFAETPRGTRPFLIAGIFGLGAGIVGAAVYYAVIAIANLQIGIVAILIGYMVGRAVRKGAGGRGGRRFQVLATALTYASIALAYTPVVIKAAIDARNVQKAQTTSSNRAAVATDGGRAATPKPTGRGFIVALVVLFAFIAALPVIVVVGSFPSGLISGFIIFIGMRQAWRMTGAPRLDILGPYRVGVAPVAAPA